MSTQSIQVIEKASYVHRFTRAFIHNGDLMILSKTGQMLIIGQAEEPQVKFGGTQAKAQNGAAKQEKAPNEKRSHKKKNVTATQELEAREPVVVNGEVGTKHVEGGSEETTA